MPTDTSAAPTPPKLGDFPDAEIVGGAVLLDGKNMGTVQNDGTVEVNEIGRLWLDNAAKTSPPTVQTIDTVPDPVPVGVIDPAKMAPVQTKAKAAVRKRKQNEAVVDAMNSPTDEEEAGFVEADAAGVGPGAPELAPNSGRGAPVEPDRSNPNTGAPGRIQGGTY